MTQFHEKMTQKHHGKGRGKIEKKIENLKKFKCWSSIEFKDVTIWISKN